MTTRSTRYASERRGLGSWAAIGLLLVVGCSSTSGTRTDAGGVEAGTDGSRARDGALLRGEVSPGDAPLAPDAAPDRPNALFDLASPSVDVAVGLDGTPLDVAIGRDGKGPDGSGVTSEVGSDTGTRAADGAPAVGEVFGEAGHDTGIQAAADGGAAGDEVLREAGVDTGVQVADSGTVADDGGADGVRADAPADGSADGTGGGADDHDWLRRSPLASPTKRSGHAMAYDKARGRVLLFGGYQGSSRLNDTWEWDGSTWTQRAPATSPPARNVPGMVYDSQRERIVLFGGYNGTTQLNDTWEWNGTTWTQRLPISAPAVRSVAPMAYDSARGRTVLFGGAQGSGYESDTWEWDGTNWALRSPLNVPPARANAGMAYDALRAKVVMFGGSSVQSGTGRTVYLSDTWEWNGNDWTPRTTTSAPSERAAFGSLVFDPVRGTTLLFGGRAASDTHFSDTWEWDGITWTERHPANNPTPRAGSAIAQDDTRSATVMFGGTSATGFLFDTWEYLIP